MVIDPKENCHLTTLHAHTLVAKHVIIICDNDEVLHKSHQEMNLLFDIFLLSIFEH